MKKKTRLVYIRTEILRKRKRERENDIKMNKLFFNRVTCII